MDVLKTIPDCSVDACVTDPPYDLVSIQKRFGKEGSAPAQHGTDGAFARLSKGFMGKSWDGTGIAFRVDLWEEVMRVLKPGGHLAAFGGTRTHHRMAVAIEDAGFEIRDSIDWIYGSGFPKSLDVSKAIDKKAGVEREVVGSKVLTGMREDRANFGAGDRSGGQGMGFRPGDVAITAPATDLAKQWEGWGTALKPAHEPIILARKPIAESSVAANAVEWGTGALNIDACRVGTDTILSRKDGGFGDNFMDDNWQPNPLTPYQAHAGRWPSNLLLTHSASCNGVCADDCPVKALNEQSGTLTSGQPLNRAHTDNSGRTAFGVMKGTYQHSGFGDSGGASRFFPTFSYEPEYDAPFFYCAKASRSERNEGCGHIAPQTHPWVQHREDAHGGKISPAQERFATSPAANTHPTVKPVALMRWLCKLVTPRGGVILDPFLGSGTTGVGAFQEGYAIVAIEREAEYMEIARARIEHAVGQGRQLDMFGEVSA